jgi:hypothetical protein
VRADEQHRVLDRLADGPRQVEAEQVGVALDLDAVESRSRLGRAAVNDLERFVAAPAGALDEQEPGSGERTELFGQLRAKWA